MPGITIQECFRNNLCIDCDNTKCGHCGQLIADCPKYRCDRPKEAFEDYDTGSVGVADFYEDCEAFGYWQEYYDSISLGFVDSDFVEIKVKKWMPIPKEE